MRKFSCGRIAAALFVLMSSITTSLTVAATLESFPVLLPTGQVYGDCGPVARCFPRLNDLKPNTVVVGSSGQVSIFRRQASGEWQLNAALLDPFAPEPRPYYNSDFGYLASLDGGLIAVAALPENQRVIYLFKRESGQWQWLQTIKLDRSFGDLYIRQLVLRDETLAVSKVEYATDATGKTEAKVLLFSRARDGQFRLQQQLDPARNPDQDYAYSIALDNHTLALATAGGGGNAGAAYLYRHHDVGRHGSRWNLQQVIQPRRLAASAGFGSVIALSGNGLAIAAPYEVNPAPTLFPGTVYVYRRHGNHWLLGERVVDPVTEADQTGEQIELPSELPFATQLGFSGQRLLVRHQIYFGGSTSILFERNRGVWNAVARLTDNEVSDIVEELLLAGATAAQREPPANSFSPYLRLYDLPELQVNQQADDSDQ